MHIWKSGFSFVSFTLTNLSLGDKENDSGDRELCDSLGGEVGAVIREVLHTLTFLDFGPGVAYFLNDPFPFLHFLCVCV